MLNKPKHEMSYASFIENLVINGYIPKGSTKVSQTFINNEVKLIREKKSKLSSNMRSILLALADTKPTEIVTAENK